MSDYAKTAIFVCAENAITMICWTVLAYLFGHWWIALFAAFFVTTLKRTKKDGEGKESHD